MGWVVPLLDFHVFLLPSFLVFHHVSGSFFKDDHQSSQTSLLRERLENFDILYPDNFRKKLVKRGAGNPNPSSYNQIHEITVATKFQKPFRVLLTPKRGLFTRDFRAVTRDPDSGKEEPIHLDPDQFFEGHVSGARNSFISANFDDDGALTGSIDVDGETLHFEPAWRHVPDAPLNATLVYRLSDFKNDALGRNGDGHTHKRSGRCGFVQVEEDSLGNSSSWSESNFDMSLKRRRRQLEGEPRNRCSLKLVADYLFFKNIGKEDRLRTTRYLVTVVDRVNEIYRGTVWQNSDEDPGIRDQGFVIKELVILKSPTNIPNHYNSRYSNNRVEQLLKNFTLEEGSRDVCLVHLFTYRSFGGGVLGLGYIASARVGDAGGICGAPTRRGGKTIYYNTALSSAQSTYGGAVVAREADIVTAHEFGHNWGSPHDEPSAECSPSGSSGGAYIMHTFSVSGYDSNNKKFSPCSKRSIKAILSGKSQLCFQEAQDQFCGNQRVEKGVDWDEECDVGLDRVDDPCCTPQCTLRPGKQCSPHNSPCCKEDCSFKQHNITCQKADKDNCQEAAKCTGESGECPEPEPMANRTRCLDDGECQNGECVSFCEREDIGKLPCICENVTESCYRCCRDPWSNSECRPLERLPEHRKKLQRDGRACIHGYCNEEGQCIRSSQDVVEHLWNIIQSLDSSSFKKFLESNLVGTVIVLSLIVWIPASCLVNHIDKKKLEERRKLYEGSDGGRIEVVKDIKSVNYSPAASYL